MPRFFFHFHTVFKNIRATNRLTPPSEKIMNPPLIKGKRVVISVTSAKPIGNTHQHQTCSAKWHAISVKICWQVHLVLGVQFVHYFNKRTYLRKCLFESKRPMSAMTMSHDGICRESDHRDFSIWGSRGQIRQDQWSWHCIICRRFDLPVEAPCAFRRTFLLNLSNLTKKKKHYKKPKHTPIWFFFSAFEK